MSVLMIMLAVNKCVTTYQAHTLVVVMMAFSWMKMNVTVEVCKLTSYLCVSNN